MYYIYNIYILYIIYHTILVLPTSIIGYSVGKNEFVHLLLESWISNSEKIEHKIYILKGSWCLKTLVEMPIAKHDSIAKL